MNKEFIPHEQAIELTKLGFNEECFRYYSIDFENDTVLLLYYEDIISIAAPLYQQAFRWFREKYKLDHFVQHHIDGTNQTYFSMARKSTWDVTTHDTYEEAELACLKKLIEIVKNK
jgi:hypothetical protein